MKHRITAVITVVLILAASVIGYGIYKNNDKNHIKSGVTINNKDFSKLSYEKAKKVSKEMEKDILSHKIIINNGNSNYSVNFVKAGISTDMEGTLEKAFAYGKSNTIVKSVMNLFRDEGKNFTSTLLLDEDKLKAYIKTVKKRTYRPPVNAKIIRVINGHFDISESRYGIILDDAKLLKTINDSIRNYKSGDIIVSAAAIRSRPKIITEDLKNINCLISSYSTFYSERVGGRAQNIKKAVSTVSGTLLMPKQQFSFNETTGRRTIKSGYKEAPVIVNNKLQPGPAGGVCQVSSTLYNAIIRANIRSIERRNHSLAPAYIQVGFDATVSEYIDYKFRNTLKYPIYIKGTAQNGKITFSIYGNKEYLKKRYKLESKIIKVLEPKTLYRNVGTLPRGKEEVVQDKHKGYKVNVYLIAMENGKEVGKTLISRDKYTKTDEIINIGV